MEQVGPGPGPSWLDVLFFFGAVTGIVLAFVSPRLLIFLAFVLGIPIGIVFFLIRLITNVRSLGAGIALAGIALAIAIVVSTRMFIRARKSEG